MCLEINSRDVRKAVFGHILGNGAIMEKQERLENQFYSQDWMKEILTGGKIGLWVTQRDMRTGQMLMLGDAQMHILLGTEEMELSPEELFSYFEQRIEPGYEKAVRDYTNKMIETGQQAEVEYYWRHPSGGKICIRCSGRLYRQQDGFQYFRGTHQDITELIRLKNENIQQEQQLRDLEWQKERYDSLFQSVLCGIMQYRVLDDGMVFIKNANREAIRILGYEQEEFWQKKKWDLADTVCEEDRERVTSEFYALKNAGDSMFFEYRVLCRGGGRCWVIGSAEVIRDPDNDLVIQSVFLDVNRRKEIEQENRQLERQLEAGDEFLHLSLEHTSIYEFYYEPASGTGRLPERTMRFYKRESPVCPHMPQVFAEEYVAPECREAYLDMYRAIDQGAATAAGDFMDKSRKHWRRVTLSALRYDKTGRAVYAVGIAEDITKEKEMETALREARSRDSLTGLYTREAGIYQVKDYLEKKSPALPCCLLLLDMDAFSAINDNWGSVFADAVLQETADILRRETKETDILIRLGGDEFMIFLKDCSRREAVMKGERITERIRQLSPESDENLQISASIGICASSVVEDYSGLYRCAESTLQYVKEKNKGHAACYLDTSNDLGTWLTNLYADGMEITAIDGSRLSVDEELTAFALELLGKSRNISDAMNLLLVRIGKRMKLDRVSISEVNHEYQSISCIYQWAANPTNFYATAPVYLSREELDSVISLYAEDGTSAKVYYGNEKIMPGILHAAFWNEGKYAGALCWEKNVENYQWSEEEKRLQKELAHIICSFTMKAKADAVSQAKTDFLSSMSHEIRTPMNAIMGMTAIARTVLDDKAKTLECLDKIETANAYLLQLINDILDMSRIESGKVELNIQRMNLHRMVNGLGVLIGPQAQAKGIIFAVKDCCCGEKDVLADELRLNQVLINILGNAVKFTPVGGHVTFTMEQLEAGETKAVFRFGVKDDGVGISREKQTTIFNAFEQEDKSTASRYGGTGLGLSISARLVQIMGGKLEVESEPGQGACFHFTLTLPYAEPEAEAAQEQETHDGRDFTGKRLLVVEDNEINREIAVTLLGQWGFMTEEAVNGKEAVDMFIKAPVHYYDGILMDIKMPVMDGLQATRAIRIAGKEDSIRVPIIAMSANAFSEDMKKSMESGMNGHLVKPIEVDKVKAVLQKCLT